MKFRGHHLICLQFFRGEGYSENFVAHLHNLLKRVEEELEIEVTGAADDVCMICPYLKNGICCYKEGADEKIRDMDLKALELLKIREGIQVGWKDIREKLPEISGDWARLYCGDCDWKEACEKNPLWSQLMLRIS
ncbi:MAG TPA: DUF1284 domain-containing protein [Syntrophaceae bacterium]|nr:DUF1284 domain-containing protein [Syntrophaceae bacterium]